MLNYSNTHRRDPNVKKYAFKCALTLASIVIIGFILINYYAIIWYGISTAVQVLCSGISYVFVAIAQFLKPIFSSVGQYLLWFSFLVCLWTLCVFCKIDNDCNQSKDQWTIITIFANSFFLFYTIFYMIYLGLNEDPFSKYMPIYVTFYLYLILSTMVLFKEAERK